MLDMVRWIFMGTGALTWFCVAAGIVIYGAWVIDYRISLWWRRRALAKQRAQEVETRQLVANAYTALAVEHVPGATPSEIAENAVRRWGL